MILNAPFRPGGQAILPLSGSLFAPGRYVVIATVARNRFVHFARWRHLHMPTDRALSL